MSTNLTAVLQELLQNTTNLKVLTQLMTPDATYVSLNFDNPELKKIEPWTGTHKGPQALPEVFAAIQRFWKTLDFKVTDTIEQGSRVAMFGSFTYKSNVTGKEITSPFGLLARFEGGRWPTSSFSRTAMALQARSKLGARHDSTAILRERKLRSKAQGIHSSTGSSKMVKVSNEDKLHDYIVVGAGAAGSVLAAELSASGAQVLVIESGGPDDAPTIANPSVWFYNVGGPLDYHLPITPSPRLNNRKFNMALGHVLGGGSSINAMVWMRGMQRDYDGWANNGAKGWAFADVLPVFKAQEDWEGGANEWRGTGGPVHIRRPKDPHPTAPAFLEAAREMGMRILDDVNGPMRAGAGYINMNIAADGTRVSAARAFLHPALSRPNLTLLLNTSVVKLNFKGNRCVGVKLITDGPVKDIAADKEVILAAGTINSPKLLMLSGVGEAKALRNFGIDVVENLPGVGGNLQDHVLALGVVFKYNGKMPDRPSDSNAVEAEAYLSSDPSGDTDISLVLHQMPVVTPEVGSRFGTPPPDSFTIAPALVQPTSIGSVRLASDSFRDAAVIDGNYLSTDHDVTALVRAVEAARQLGSQRAFDNLRENELIPGPNATAEEILELARLAATSFGHGVGTCKMGVDELAVVDPELRVHGLQGLRVADASVMPRIITGPGTNASAHMIGSRAAKLILD